MHPKSATLWKWSRISWGIRFIGRYLKLHRAFARLDHLADLPIHHYLPVGAAQPGCLVQDLVALGVVVPDHLGADLGRLIVKRLVIGQQPLYERFKGVRLILDPIPAVLAHRPNTGLQVRYPAAILALVPVLAALASPAEPLQAKVLLGQVQFAHYFGPTMNEGGVWICRCWGLQRCKQYGWKFT